MCNMNIPPDKIEKDGPRIVNEALITTPYLRPDYNSPSIGVEFGNSGFRIFFSSFSGKAEQQYTSIFDFTPDGCISRQNSFAAKHADVLGSALYRVYELLNSPEEMLKLKLLKEKVLETSNLTRLTLVNAISFLFNKYEHGDIVTSSPSVINDRGHVSINLKKFSELSNTDPLIKYLRRLSIRARSSLMEELEEQATFRKNTEN